MSKHSLRHSATLNSGVTFDQSEVYKTLRPNVFDRLGGEEGTKLLSTLFYNRVFSDSKNPWFVSIFASSHKKEAIDNQYRFFVQTFGGPTLYTDKKGGRFMRLAGRHAAYPIGTRSATRWVEHMISAMAEHPSTSVDGELRYALNDYFNFIAHYIVATMEYMRPDQLSGGTKMDPDRVW